MKYIKKFENINLRNYDDKFFIKYPFLDVSDEKFSIILVKHVMADDYNTFKNITITGDNFIVYKNSKLKNGNLWIKTLSKSEFDKIIFMTLEEFYKNYTELCTDLYSKIIDDLKYSTKNIEIETLNRFNSVLENIPELEYIKMSNIYNL